MSGKPYTGWQPAGRDRDAWGYIVTFQNAAGKTLTLHRTGRAALATCCDDALSLDETFRVLSVSNPVTIAGDLRGRLPSEKTGSIDVPEWQALGRVGRQHLLHPSIRPRSATATRRARGRGERW